MDHRTANAAVLHQHPGHRRGRVAAGGDGEVVAAGLEEQLTGFEPVHLDDHGGPSIEHDAAAGRGPDVIERPDPGIVALDPHAHNRRGPLKGRGGRSNLARGKVYGRGEYVGRQAHRAAHEIEPASPRPLDEIPAATQSDPGKGADGGETLDGQAQRTAPPPGTGLLPILLRSDADAADAAQEALISIVRSIGKFDGRSSFGTWVYRIATNASLDELRRRRRRPMLADHDDHDDGHLPDHHGEVRIDQVADRMALDQALRALPEDFRVPLVLRDVGDLDYAEIADTLGIPVGTVKSRIARGRAGLATLLRSGNQLDPDRRPTPAP